MLFISFAYHSIKSNGKWNRVGLRVLYATLTIFHMYVKQFKWFIINKAGNCIQSWRSLFRYYILCIKINRFERFAVDRLDSSLWSMYLCFGVLHIAYRIASQVKCNQFILWRFDHNTTKLFSYCVCNNIVCYHFLCTPLFFSFLLLHAFNLRLTYFILLWLFLLQSKSHDKCCFVGTFLILNDYFIFYEMRSNPELHECHYEWRMKNDRSKLQPKSIKFNKRSYKLYYKQIRYLTKLNVCLTELSFVGLGWAELNRNELNWWWCMTVERQQNEHSKEAHKKKIQGATNETPFLINLLKIDMRILVFV